MKPARSLGDGGQLFEEILRLGRQFGKAPCLGTIRKLVVDPQVLHDLDQVALPRSIESANPDARLFRLVEITKVRRQDALQTVGILSVTHEVADLVAERVDLWVGLPGDRK